MKVNSRRTFFKFLTKVTAEVAVASIGIYVIGRAFADLDGRMTAGAKTWQTGPVGPCTFITCGTCGDIPGATCGVAGITCCNTATPMPASCQISGGSNSGSTLICQ